MTVMNWTEELDIGVDAMNQQHQVLIGIMNRLHDQFEAGADQAEQAKSLVELAEFTVKHFKEEEQYMAAIQYPTLESHKMIHAKLLEEFDTHKANFEKTGKLAGAFFTFLKLWLKAHIMGIDKKYGSYSA